MTRPPEHNPIIWRGWNQEAFLAARREEKPILLTLSATWCHWCHVMDDTSYSDPRVIDLVNSRFIPVRVDVDQRPDISRRYNQGGFPSVAILDGQGDLVAGQVYQPPDEMVGFLEKILSGLPMRWLASLKRFFPAMRPRPRPPKYNAQTTPPARPSVSMDRLSDHTHPE